MFGISKKDICLNQNVFTYEYRNMRPQVCHPIITNTPIVGWVFKYNLLVILTI